MSEDHSKKLDALKQLSTKLTKKETPDAELWAAAGMKVGSRLKDVNNQIVSVKKLVSLQNKKAVAEEEGEEEDDAGAKRAFHGQKPEEKTNARQQGRDKKLQANAVHAGDFDLATDRMYYDGDGELAQL